MTMTGSLGSISWMARKAFRPSIPGRRTSMITRSGVSAFTRARAASPLEAVFTWWPSSVKSFSKLCRNCGSSSTIKIFPILSVLEGQGDDEGCPLPGSGRQFQPAAVVFDDPGGDAQAQAGALLLGAEKWLKELGPDGFGDARAGVTHPDDHRLPRGRRQPGLLLDGDNPAIHHDLAGIDQQVGQDFLELVRITQDLRQSLRPQQLHLHPVGFETMAQQLQGSVHHVGGPDVLHL